MKKFVLWIILFVGLVGCAKSADTSIAPEIRHGEDICQRCGMIISDDRYSAAYWTTTGEARIFDDIGGMLAYYSENSEDVGSFWVHDFNTRDFIGADSTYLVLSDMQTPMGFGIAACANQSEAEALAAEQENAMVMSFKDVLAQLDAGELILDPEQRLNQEMPDGMDHDGMNMSPDS